MSKQFFNVKKPDQVVTIIDDSEQFFYKLSDGNMIKKETFALKYQPMLENVNESMQAPRTNTNTLDANSFFNTPTIPSDVVDGIKNTDPSKATEFQDNQRSEVRHNTGGVPNPSNARNVEQSVNESLVRQVEDDVIPNHTNTDVSKYKVYDNDEEAYADFLKNNQTNNNQQAAPRPQQSDIAKEKMKIELTFDDEKMTFGEEEAIKRRTKRLSKLPAAPAPATQQSYTQPDANGSQPMTQPTSTPQPALSAVEMMFSTFKRNHDITINVEFKDKIGSPDFVKMMVENMDGDIVGYYKRLVMDNIMKDLGKIEKIVEHNIKMEIFGEDIPEEVIPEEIIEEIKSEEEKYVETALSQADGVAEKVKELYGDKETTDDVLVEETLIPGKKTASGKQKYKYVDEIL